MTVRGYFGDRSLDSMLRDWNAHRAATQTGDIEAIQSTFDACEEWIDFALGRGRFLVLEDRSKKKTPAGSLQPGQAARRYRRSSGDQIHRRGRGMDA